MARPTSTVYQMEYQNPHAQGKLTIPVLVVCNTSDDDLKANIRANSARDREWIGFKMELNRNAIMCGGGPSLAESLPKIKALRKDGHRIFAMNGASHFLTSRGIDVDYQVIADAKPETAMLIDDKAAWHLLASQVNPSCFDILPDAKLWHLECEGMEDEFPEGRRKAGGYALIGGGASVGNSALCLAYVMGYRKFEIFGYDSSHRGDASHAYEQPMNRFIPVIDVEWAGKTYSSSVAMKAQAEKFQITGQALTQAGCKLTVHGDGLLPAMWNTPPENISEKNKYELMWQTESYRDYSPGEQLVDMFLTHVKPDGLIIDFGCGTGRASLELATRGHSVLLIDFAGNCRDEEALWLPFLEWDLTKPCPASAKYGFCTDVMEHVPTADVVCVLENIMNSTATVFFQICTVPDVMGAMIGQPLHLTVKPHEWWRDVFTACGFDVAWETTTGVASLFIVKNHNHPSTGEQ